MDLTFSIGLHIQPWLILATVGPLVSAAVTLWLLRRRSTERPQEHLHLNFAPKSLKEISAPDRVQNS